MKITINLGEDKLLGTLINWPNYVPGLISYEKKWMPFVKCPVVVDGINSCAVYLLGKNYAPRYCDVKDNNVREIPKGSTITFQS